MTPSDATSPADQRLRSLPAYADAALARPAGVYAGFSRVGDMLYTSGVVGRAQGRVIAGALQDAADVPHGERAAVAAVLALLRAVQETYGSLQAVRKVVVLNGYLCTAPGFTQHVAVMNAASAILQQVWPDAPLPVRTTVGVASLPGGGTAEVAMVIELVPGAVAQAGA